MAEKVCRRCEVTKPLTEFYKHPGMSDGTLNFCKVCKRTEAKDRLRLQLENPDWRAKEADRQRCKELNRYHTALKNDPEYWRKGAARKKRWAVRNPEKRKAQNAVNNALRDGRISKPSTCEKCGKLKKLHGHHADYSKPLEVVWLCAACHSTVHRRDF